MDFINLNYLLFFAVLSSLLSFMAVTLLPALLIISEKPAASRGHSNVPINDAAVLNTCSSGTPLLYPP